MYLLKFYLSLESSRDFSSAYVIKICFLFWSSLCSSGHILDGNKNIEMLILSKCDVYCDYK